MPLPTIPKGLPDVPDVPGVPPLDRLGNKVALLEPANIFQSSIQKVPYLRGVLQAAQAEVWGIFTKGGEQVIVPDVFNDLSHSAQTKVARFYVEEGTFANYNKVEEAEETTVVLIKTGTYEQLTEYLEEVRAIKSSIELYDIVTPERSITDVNLESFDYTRTRSGGTNMITFNLHFVEIREVAIAYSTRTIPVAAQSQDRGQQQPKEPNVSILSKLQTAVSG